MRLSYDDEIDAAYLRLCEDEDELQRPITSETFRPTRSEAGGDYLVLDFDAWGRLVGIEFLTPTERLLPSVLAAAEWRSRCCRQGAAAFAACRFDRDPAVSRLDLTPQVQRARRACAYSPKGKPACALLVKRERHRSSQRDSVQPFRIETMSDKLHEVFLPYTADQLLPHFVLYDREGENPEKYLAHWRKRIEDAPSKDRDWLERDETFWTANALMAIQQKAHCAYRWKTIMSKLFGPVPPTTKRLEWSDLLQPDLKLFFEIGLPSPPVYKTWLSKHLDDRQVLAKRREMAEPKGEALEGRTHLDALLLSPTSGFALHFEAKVVADIDTHITYDSLRNQLARNIDSMAAPASSTHSILGKRNPDRSFFVMLTPELFRRNWHSRLYGHLVREYATDPSAIQRDLPHLDGFTCAALSRRIGWLTFEDLRSVDPNVCPW